MGTNLNINDLEKLIIQNYKTATNEFQRLFHGRGGCYNTWEFLTVDSIDRVLYVVFFNEVSETLEKKLLDIFSRIFEVSNYTCVILQKRYLLKELSKVRINKF